MNRFFLFFVAALSLCCTVAAQNQAPDKAGDAGPASAPIGVTTTVSPEVAQFQKIEDSWADAVNRRDQYGLELVLSPLFVDVSASGDVTTRNQQVAQVISSDDKTVYLAQKVITVRTLGDIAVVNGTYSLRHKVNSTLVEDKGVFTHVFERAHGGWLCINSQRTGVHPEMSAKQKKASSAQMPFHIPFFGKSDKGPEGDKGPH